MFKIQAPRLRVIRRIHALLISLVVAYSSAPVAAMEPAVPSKPVVVSRTVHPPAGKVNRIHRSADRAESRTHSLPPDPGDTAIEVGRFFSEPLIPMHSTRVPGENRALAAALAKYQSSTQRDDDSMFRTFLNSFPTSRWRASLQYNLGNARFSCGYFSEALSRWDDAWKLAKAESAIQQKQVADGAMSKILMLTCRLGRTRDLEQLLHELRGRPLYGSVHTEYQQAIDALSQMKNYPDLSFRCGPLALQSVAKRAGTHDGGLDVIRAARSTTSGTSLAQVQKWAVSAGLDYVAARRDRGVQVPVPSVVHWKLGHFGALVSKRGRDYLLEDSTFDRLSGIRLTEEALDAETDGYFLIPRRSLSKGWNLVSTSEAARVFGKGQGDNRNPNEKTQDCPMEEMPPDSCPVGMPKSAIFSAQATHNIADIPLSYAPPIGNSTVDFRVNYNYNEANQPANPNFSNLGPNWSFNWVSYVYGDQPQYNQPVTVQVRGGGAEYYPMQPNIEAHYHNEISQAVLIAHPTIGGVGQYYERDLPDGSVEIFDLWDGVPNQGRWFMTSVIDPQGNRTTINYDSNLRVTEIVDSFGQVSTVSYGSNTSGQSGFFSVTQVTDPFGRLATFSYDSTYTSLLYITDQMGLTSSFVYGTSADPSFITALTTPYGTTKFAPYTPAGTPGPKDSPLGIQVSFSDGTNTKLENWIGLTAKTFFWDREALMMFPSDPLVPNYTHCKITKWLYENTPSQVTSIPVYVQPALDDMTWFVYQGQRPLDTSHLDCQTQGPFGGINKPVITLRCPRNSLPDPNKTAPSNAVQTSTAAYPLIGVDTAAHVSPAADSFGHPLQTQDALTPTARTMTYAYASNNIDLVAVQNAAGEIVSASLYNRQHQPLQTSNASGQVTRFLYNSQGQLLTRSDPLGNSTTSTYSSQSVTVGSIGPRTVGDVLTITINNSAFGQISVQHTVASTTESLSAIAKDLNDKVNNDQTLSSNNVHATWVAFDSLSNTPDIFLTSFSANPTTYQVTTSSGANETLTLATSTSGYLVQVQGPLGQASSGYFTYDNVGRIYSITDPEGYQRIYSYDAGDRIVQILYPDATRETFVYDRLDQVVTTDRLGRTNQRIFDEFDQLAAEIDSNGNRTEYSWCACGSLSSLTDPTGNVTRWDHDLQGRVITKTFADSTQQAFGYDALGRLATQTDARGLVRTYSYNTDNSLSAVSYSDSTPVSTFQYDALYPRLTQAGNTNSTAAYSYNSGSKGSFASLLIGGAPASGNTINVTINNCRFAGGQYSVPQFTLSADDSTTAQTAIDLAAAINNDATVNGAGIVAYASGSAVYFPCAGSVTATATTTGGVAISAGTTQKGTIASTTRISVLTANSGTTFIPRFICSSLSGGSYLMSPGFTVPSGDAGDTEKTAADFAAAINQNSTLATAGISAYTFHSDVILAANCPITVLETAATSALSSLAVTKQSVVVIQNPVAGDVISLTVYNSKLSGGSYLYTYTVASSDAKTPQNVAIHAGPGTAGQLAPSINTTTTLSNAGIHAYASGGKIVIYGDAETVVAATTNGASIAYTDSSGMANSARDTTLWVAGNPAAADTLSATFTSLALPGSHIYSMPSYVVPAGDAGNAPQLAADYAAAINADSTLASAGITASQSAGTTRITVSGAQALSVTANATGSTALTVGGGARLGQTTTLLPSSTSVPTNYVYDADNRPTKRLISGTGNTVSWTYDQVGRITNESNPLGSWTYGYVDTSKGLSYLSSVNYPNGQVASYAYGNNPNGSDWRVLQVQNLKTASGPILSQFDYNYDNSGQVSLRQQQQNGANTFETITYDPSGQLLSTQKASGVIGPPWSEQRYFAYDAQGNRTSTQLTTATGIATTALQYGYNPVNELSSIAGGGGVRYQGTTNTAVRSATSEASALAINLSAPIYGYSVTGTSFTATPGPWIDGKQTLTFAGASPQAGDAISVTVQYFLPAARSLTFTHTLGINETPNDIATNVAAAFNSGGTGLNNHNLSATASGAAVTFEIKPVSLSATVSPGAPESVTITQGVNGTQLVNIGGSTRPAPDQIAISFSNSLISGSASYTYQSGDSLSSIAKGLSAALNSSLAAYGLRCAPIRSELELASSKAFAGDLVLPTGSTQTSVLAFSGGNAVTAVQVPVNIATQTAATLSYDAAGNCVDDGTNSYSWDAECRLTQIIYPGTGNSTQLSYDALGRCVRITELTSGSTSSTKDYLWCSDKRCEVRDASGSRLTQYFDRGQINFNGASSTPYFYSIDEPLQSVRELTDASGTIQAQYAYSPWGEETKLQGAAESDFGFAGYLRHQRSNLNLTLNRVYKPTLGRWLSRDRFLEPESGMVNLYAYAGNNPIMFTDPLGLMTCEELEDAITKARNGLAKRAQDLREDKLKLPPTGPGSIEGHKHQFRCRQAELRDLLNQWNAQGCGGGGGPGLPADAWDLATMPTPQKSPEPGVAAPATYKPFKPPEIPWWIMLGIRLGVKMASRGAL